METWKTYHQRVIADTRLLLEALEYVIDGVVITAAKLEDNPIVYASRGFYKLTGYNEAEVLGKNCRFLQGPETSLETLEVMRRSLSDGMKFSDTLQNYKKNGEIFTSYVRIEPFFDESNEIEYFIGSQMEVSRIK